MILKTRGADVSLRASGLSAFIPDFGAGQVTPAVPLNEDTARGIPAVTQAVRIAATQVAMLDFGVYTGQDLDKKKVTRGRLAQLFAGQPNDQQSIFDFKETIEESLSYRGNAYVWLNADPQTGIVVEWFALHPDQVFPIFSSSSERRYLVMVSPEFVDPTGKGSASYEVGSDVMLHIKGHGSGGKWIAPSPVSIFRLGLARALGKIHHENAVYSKGASLRGVISFPEGVKREQVESFKEIWQDTYEGVSKAGQTGIIGAGGKFTPIGLTMEDAQFVEAQQYDVEEVARMLNVAASIMGGGATTGGRAQAPLTPEHEKMRWLDYGLGPRLFRIESAVHAHPSLFNGKSDLYPWFKTTGFARGDSVTEAQIAMGKVQSGQWLVDEARARDELGPLPDGAGKIPQIVPVGGGANPNPDLSGATGNSSTQHPNDHPDGE